MRWEELLDRFKERDLALRAILDDIEATHPDHALVPWLRHDARAGLSICDLWHQMADYLQALPADERAAWESDLHDVASESAGDVDCVLTEVRRLRDAIGTGGPSAILSGETQTEEFRPPAS